MKGTYKLKLPSSPFNYSTKLHPNQLVIKQRGFTIVELIIVILLVGILAINVGTRFFSNSSFADRNVADELVEAIRYAQHLAMSRGGGIQIVTTATSYTVQKTDATAIPNPNRTGDYSVTIPDNSSLTAKTISFNGLGKPDTALDTNITIGSGNHVVTIETETGYAYY